MFSKKSLELDLNREVDKITAAMRDALGHMRRRGVVLGLSGGIDSSVSCALAVKAFGKERVLGLFMPEKDSSDDALTLGTEVATAFGVETRLENLGPTLKAIGCYGRQAEAIRTVEPLFGEGWKFKLSLPSILDA